jgi:hypothetical protein
MSCGDFEKIIPQLAGWGLIEATRQVAAVRHAEACANCAGRLADERLLLSEIRRVRAELAKQEAPAPLQEILLNAFRQQSAAILTPAPIPQRKKVWNSWKSGAIAAAILLATSAGAGVFVLSRRGDDAQPPRVNVLPHAPAPAVTTPKTHDQPDQIANAQKPRRRVKHLARTVETVTEYFPLIEGEDLEQLEFTQVVRVELTPAALREVGLPPGYASESELVKADLILGHDGIARAIRFVR